MCNVSRPLYLSERTAFEKITVEVKNDLGTGGEYISNIGNAHDTDFPV